MVVCSVTFCVGGLAGLLAARLSGGGNLISMPSKGFGRFLLVSAARGSVSGCGGAVGCPGCRAHLPVAGTDGASEFCGLVYWEVPLVFFYFGAQFQFGCSLQSMFFWVWCFSACVRNIYLCIGLIVCGGDLWAGLV